MYTGATFWKSTSLLLVCSQYFYPCMDLYLISIFLVLFNILVCALFIFMCVLYFAGSRSTYARINHATTGSGYNSYMQGIIIHRLIL